MRKVPDSNLPLLINVGNEWAAVVDTEVEDSVLVGCLKSCTEDGSVLGLRNWRQIEAVERRKHAEFKLDVVIRREDEWSEVVVFIFGDLDLEMLSSS